VRDLDCRVNSKPFPRCATPLRNVLVLATPSPRRAMELRKQWRAEMEFRHE
jgi:hypothetical protein